MKVRHLDTERPAYDQLKFKIAEVKEQKNPCVEIRFKIFCKNIYQHPKYFQGTKYSQKKMSRLGFW